ncbi:MAG: cadherin-like domain-containing protein, partial [Fuerstia sp.]|nr:cadherin-like domain-containing protein [Fuerstiella sp.]
MLLVSFLSSLGRSLGRGAVRRRSRLSDRRQTGLVSVSERLEARTLLVVTIGSTNVDALLTDVDGDGLADPGDTLQHTVTITNSGNMDATGVNLNVNEDSNTTLVGGSIRITPIAFDDAYALTGNTPITINAAAGVLANDIDPDSSTPLSNVGLTAVSLNVTGTTGSVSLNTNGSFTYTPATGFNGTDTFQYTARDATSLNSLVTGTVTMTVSGMVWYVDSSYGGGNGAADGSFNRPFTSLAPLNGAGGGGDADAAGHTIFVYESGASYSTGLELENSQILIGESAGLSINGTTIGGSGSAPTISRATGSTIALATSNDLRGLNVTNSAGSGITGTAVGTLLLSNLSATVTGGTALSLTTSGTVSSSGTNNLTSTNGTALNVSDVTIAAAGLTFRSISSGSGAGSAGVGINLVNTGTSGGLTVTGTGSAGSGGTIQHKTGADGSTTAGIGIFLNNTRNVALNWMQLNDFDNFAIRGTSVTNFSLIDSIV